MKTLVLVFSLCFLSFLSLNSARAASAGDVIINEIAWMGTTASYNDEWIELHNNTDSPIILDGWILKATDGSPEINLSGTVPAQGFFLLERTNDDTVAGIPADQIYKGALGNNGETLSLYDNSGNLIDAVDASSGWPAGDNSTKQTMERTAAGWQTSANPGGTPGEGNSSPPVSQPAEDSPLLIEKPTETKPQETEIKKSYETNKELHEAKPRKNADVWWIAGLMSVFSAGAILILKKKCHNK